MDRRQVLALGGVAAAGTMLPLDRGDAAPRRSVALRIGRNGFDNSDPIAVATGERILFRLSHDGAAGEVLLALPRHRFHVVALDGYPVPNPATVETLALGAGERIDAMVEMNAPGRWQLAAIDPRHGTRQAVAIAYDGSSGAPLWQPPAAMDFHYARFAAATGGEATAALIECAIHAEGDRWRVVDRHGAPLTRQSLTVGAAYRLRVLNRTRRAHALRLGGGPFALRRIGQAPLAGLMKDTAVVPPYDVMEADFIARPGLALISARPADRAHGFHAQLV